MTEYQIVVAKFEHHVSGCRQCTRDKFIRTTCPEGLRLMKELNSFFTFTDKVAA